MNDSLNKSFRKDSYSVCVEEVNQGKGAAMYALGRAYFYGEEMIQDIDQGKALWQKAAEKGVYLGLYQLAIGYYWGDEVHVNPKKAIRYWSEASKMKDPVSLRQLASCAYRGEGMEQDVEKAIDWYLQAFHLGCTEALDGLMMLCSSNAPIDESENSWLYFLESYAKKHGCEVLTLLADYCLKRSYASESALSKVPVPSLSEISDQLDRLHCSLRWVDKRDDASEQENYDNLDDHDENKLPPRPLNEMKEVLGTWTTEQSDDHDRPMNWIDERDDALEEDDFDALHDHDETKDIWGSEEDIIRADQAPAINHDEIDQNHLLVNHQNWHFSNYYRKSIILRRLSHIIEGVEEM